MHEIRTVIEIAATPEQIWAVLVDPVEYPQWNPFIRSLKGIIKKGERLTVFIQPTGSKGMTFRPTVLVAKPHQEIRWLGHLLLPNIFDGEHYFQIEVIAPNCTRFIHGEKFSGILVGFFKSSLDGETKAGFEAMNQALKIRAEMSNAIS
jgi:hypothetical protein